MENNVRMDVLGTEISAISFSAKQSEQKFACKIN